MFVVFHQGAISENEAFVLGVEGILTEDEMSETLRVGARRSCGACLCRYTLVRTFRTANV